MPGFISDMQMASFRTTPPQSANNTWVRQRHLPPLPSLAAAPSDPASPPASPPAQPHQPHSPLRPLTQPVSPRTPYSAPSGVESFFTRRDPSDGHPSQNVPPTQPHSSLTASHSPKAAGASRIPSTFSADRVTSRFSPAVRNLPTRKASQPDSVIETISMNRWNDQATTTLNRPTSNDEASKRHVPKPKRRTPPKLDLSRLFSRRKSSQTSTHPAAPPSSYTPRSIPSSELSPSQLTPRPPHRASGSPGDPLSPSLRKPDEPRLDPDNARYTRLNVHRAPSETRHRSPEIQIREADANANYTSLIDEYGNRLPKNKPLPKCPRDTFLSMSTARTDSLNTNSSSNLALEAMQLGISSRNRPKRNIGRSRSNEEMSTISGRSSVRHSSSSLGTTVRSVSPGHKKPLTALKTLGPDSSFQGHSILVLSDADDSEDEFDEKLTPQTHIANVDDITEGSIHDANIGTVYSVKSPRPIHREAADKRPLLPEIDSSPSAESSSPDSDGGTFQEDSVQEESVRSSASSRSIDELSRGQPWLESATTSVNAPTTQEAPYRQSGYSFAMRHSLDSVSMHQTEISGPVTPPAERIARAFREKPTRTHQLMAVTAEEAQLLSAMRARRASVQQRFLEVCNGDNTEGGSSQPHVRNFSRPSAPDSGPRPSTVFTDLSGADPANGIMIGARDFAAERSKPEGTVDDSQSRESYFSADAQQPPAAPADHIWDDVQTWRKQMGREGPRKASRPFSEETPMPPERPAQPKQNNSDDLQAWYHRYERFGSVGERAHNARAESPVNAGEDSGSLSRQDSITRDVLAAWGDLGGRQSGMIELGSG